ncbi:Subtilisin-like protease SBT3-like protein [Drosera capensis]
MMENDEILRFHQILPTPFNPKTTSLFRRRYSTAAASTVTATFILHELCPLPMQVMSAFTERRFAGFADGNVLPLPLQYNYEQTEYMSWYVPAEVCYKMVKLRRCFFTSPTRCSSSTKVENYIVHMDMSAMPMAFSDHHSWYKFTLESILEASKLEDTDAESSSSSKLLYTYTHAIHGFSASLTPTELESLKHSPGFLHFTKDVPVTMDTTRSAKFIGLSGEMGAWRASDYGKEVIIGVVDTGIWPESKSFDDDGFTEVPARWKGTCEDGKRFNASMCNRKLIGARFYNKGLLARSANLTIPCNSARDDDGHGTHTSSTAAGSYVTGASYFGYAQGTAVGMAPKARVAMYKALWSVGSTSSDIVAAIDQAMMDGVDVLSLSLGIDMMYMYDDPIAVATLAAVEKGILVTTSAGNHGPYFGSLHNGSPWVITVTAGAMDREFGGVIDMGNNVSFTGRTLYPGSPNLLHSPLKFMTRCHTLKALSQVGANTTVVCLDKNGTLGMQVSNLELAKGQALLKYIKTSSSNAVASIRFGQTFYEARPAPTVASYSSRGPSVSCMSVLKPDIMAPGELILASWARDVRVITIDSGSLYSDFNVVSGTSMSCPHIAGVAALIKGVHPDWSPAAIRSAMMTTSNTLDSTNQPIKDIGLGNQPASPLAMGSGHIDPNKALDPGLIYDSGFDNYVNLLCAMNYTKEQIKLFTKSHPFNCSNASMDLNYPSFIALLNDDTDSQAITVKDFHRTVTNVGDNATTYTYNAELTPLEGLEVMVEPTALVFTKKYEKLSFKVSVKGPRFIKEKVVYGTLSWVELG